MSYSPSATRHEDFEALVRGCDAVIAPHPSEACAWAERRSLARLRELSDRALVEMLDLQTSVELRETEDGMPLRGDALDAQRAALATATAFSQWLERHVDDWDELRRRERAALLGATVSPGGLESEWAQLRADVESAEARCGGR